MEPASPMIVAARRRADIARQRATRAATATNEYLRLARERPDTAALYLRMAELHRTTRERHLAAAGMHDEHVGRLIRRVAGDRTVSPAFIAAVAALADTDSATITLLTRIRTRTRTRTTAMTCVSDTTSRMAIQYEQTFGEGPHHDALATDRDIVAAGDQCTRRWPLFGPEVIHLGVRSVAAVPLHAESGCVGTLAVYHRHRPKLDTMPLRRIADALTREVILAPDQLAFELLDESDIQPVVHQAAGMVAERLGCSTPDALLLINARAFSDGRPTHQTAQQLVNGELNLD